jgi:type VI secretion system secreted protein Hcp
VPLSRELVNPQVPRGPLTSGGASVDMFIKIKAVSQGIIPGESQDIKHKNEIQAESFRWEVSQPIDSSGSGLATGRRKLGQFKFLMTSCVATPKLLSAACTGEVLSDVTITIRKAGKEQQEYMIWKLTNGIVASVETGLIDANSGIPHDEVAISFRKIELTYKQQQADGTLGGGVSFLDEYNIN